MFTTILYDNINIYKFKVNIKYSLILIQFLGHNQTPENSLNQTPENRSDLMYLLYYLQLPSAWSSYEACPSSFWSQGCRHTAGWPPGGRKTSPKSHRSLWRPSHKIFNLNFFRSFFSLLVSWFAAEIAFEIAI